MLEARTFVDNFGEVKKILQEKNAVFKGEYELLDIVFEPKDPKKTLVDEFLRLRIVAKNIWTEKAVIVAIKKTEVKDIGKNSVVPLKKEFDSREEAEKFIKENLADKYQYSFEFNRKGWQYDLGGEQLDLEDIEGHLSIEIKSKTEEGLKKLATLFNIKDTIKGPTVLAMKILLNK